MLSPHEEADRFAFYRDCMEPAIAAKQFRESLARAKVRSVDAFLSHLPERTRVLGKRLISAHIALSESIDRLSPISGDWYELLFELLGRGASADGLQANRFSIVTFNYDRSFEISWYLHLRHRYGMDARQALEAVGRFPIYHVHGVLGALADGNWGSGREYAPNLYRLDPNEGTFQLIDEEPSDNQALLKARRLLSEAARVVFLGFAFHEANCKRLFEGVTRSRESAWRAAAFQMTSGECRVAAKMVPAGVTNLFKHDDGPHERFSVSFADSRLDAYGFVRENWDFLYD